MIEIGTAIGTTEYYFLQNLLPKKSRHAESDRKRAKIQPDYINKRIRFFSLYNFNKKI
jgi:hypothetical protein